MSDTYLAALRDEGFDHPEAAQVWPDDGSLEHPRYSRAPVAAEPPLSARKRLAIIVSLAVAAWAVAPGVAGLLLAWWR